MLLLLLVGCRQILGVDQKDFSDSSAASGGSSPDPGRLLILDSFNAFSAKGEPFFEERLPALVAALGKSPADVLCLSEVDRWEGRDALVAALSGEYPHAVNIHTDEATPVDSPTDATGALPSPLAPPCKGLEEQVAKASACAREFCSTIPGSEQGFLTSEACFTDACGFSTPSPLGSNEERACAFCLRNGAASLSLAQLRQRCESEGEMPLWRGGDHDGLLLSRHPILSSARWVLPSTGNRRVVLFARIEKPGLGPVDVYCTRLGTIYDGVLQVYHGSYGGGLQGEQAWAAEQALQARKIPDFITAISRERRAVLAGWMGASRPVQENEGTLIEGVGQETLEILDGFFLSASSPEKDRECTACKSNPLYDDSFRDRRVEHVFLRGFVGSDVVSLERVYDEATVTVAPNGASKGKPLVPLSDHYGLRLRLRLAP